MSLVVAQTTPEGPKLVSDTRVIYDDLRPSFTSGTLKTIVVTEDLAVSFAGGVEDALTAIRRFKSEIESGVIEKGSYDTLRDVTRDARAPVEFLVSNADPSATLVRIREGEVDASLNVAYIGDSKAFSAFQQARAKAREEVEKIGEFLSPGEKIMAELGSSMDEVIKDHTLESVGDFCMRLSGARGRFHYLGGMFIFLERNIEIRDGDDLVNKMALSIEDGGYAVSVVAPLESGIAAVGLHFPRANLGVLYFPIDHDQPVIIREVNPSTFADTVEQLHGVRFENPMLRFRVPE